MIALSASVVSLRAVIDLSEIAFFKICAFTNEVSVGIVKNWVSSKFFMKFSAKSDWNFIRLSCWFKITKEIFSSKSLQRISFVVVMRF